MASTLIDRIAGLGANVAMKAPCVTASTSNITLSGLFAINGVTPTEGQRVLVNGQSSAINNGIWLASANDWVRAPDADDSRDFVQGTHVYVYGGSAAGLYYVTNSGTIVPGTSAINFTGSLGTVPSVFGRGGAVIAQSGDYNTGQITNNSAASGATLNDAITSLLTAIAGKQAGATGLTNLAALSVVGLAALTAAGTWTTREIAGGTGITVTNPAGTAGNPTIAVSDDVAALTAISSGGLVARIDSTTYAARQVVQPPAGIQVANPAGLAGDITLTLANDLAALEGLSGTGFGARTAGDIWSLRSMAVASGGGLAVTNPAGVTGNPTFSIDLPGLTAKASPDGAADYLMIYSAADTTLRKVLINNMPGGGGGGAPTGAQYIVVGLDATLTDERALNVGSGMSLVDGGAGAAITINITADALASLIALTPAADRLPYYTGATTAALATFTAFARTLLDDADAATMLGTLGAAPLASPTFTGTPAAPTATAGTSTTQLATTAFVTTADNLKANLASPAFTGTPTAPTAAALTSTTQIATTAFVTTAINNLIAAAPGALDTLDELAAALGDDANFATTITNALALKAPLASPALTGTPTAPTAAAGTNTTQLATTAHVFAERANAATLTNKTLGNSNIVTLRDDRFTLQDDADNTKQVVFQLSGITTGATRTLAVPNASTTLVGTDVAQTLTNKTLTSPTITTPTGIVKGDVGLGNVDNTSDATKFASPALTGNPTAPTQAAGTNNTRIATTAFVIGELGSAGYRYLRTIYITASGTYNKSSDATSAMVEGVGGGGGGGGSQSSASAGFPRGGGGGGGGAYGRKWIASLSSSYAVTIGAGGAGGTGTGNGGAGGSTQFGTSGSVLNLGGGGGGNGMAAAPNTSNASSTSGGNGGSVTTGGDFSFPGWDGGASVDINGSTCHLGPGANSPFGSGGKGTGTNSNGGLGGNNATGYGAGGSGRRASATEGAGGDGSPGIILVHEFKGGE